MPKAAVAATLVHGSARRGELIATHSGYMDPQPSCTTATSSGGPREATRSATVSRGAAAAVTGAPSAAASGAGGGGAVPASIAV